MSEDMQKTFTIDTQEFQQKFLNAVKDGYLEGRVNVIPEILWFIVYPNKTHIIIRLKEEGEKNEKNPI